MNRETWLPLKNTIKINSINWLTLFIFIFDVSLIYLSWTMFSKDLLFKIFSCLIAAFAFLQLYLILHEATHNAISKFSFINDFFGHVCGFVVLMPFLPRQTSHLLHHTWTGHPVRDPANNRMIKKFSVITEKEIANLETIWKYWIPAIVINDRIGLWMSPHKIKKSGHLTNKIEKELLWNKIYMICYFIFFIALIMNDQLTTFILWFIPAVVIAFIIEELVNLPHHAETPLLKPTDKAIPYWEQQTFTHSCKTIPVWSYFVILNFNLHVAHHFFPTAPWNILPDLDQKIRESLKSSDEHLNEFSWSVINRRKPIMNLMGHYFSKKTQIN